MADVMAAEGLVGQGRAYRRAGGQWRAGGQEGRRAGGH